ncbi:MAG TPA: hypothetical protein PLY87_17650 [Planctomycetaceae bacterium]|nr:hypothetical protein [Planctomycetaceae bacterium]
MSAARLLSRRRNTKALVRSVQAVFERMEPRQMLCTMPHDAEMPADVVMFSGGADVYGMALKAGESYRIVATGAFSMNGNDYDAEKVDGNPPVNSGYGIEINGTDGVFTGSTFGGSYEIASFTAVSDAPIQIGYNYGPNYNPQYPSSGSGAIAIYIYANSHLAFEDMFRKADYGALASQDPNALGESNRYSTESASGVRLVDGQFQLDETDLSTEGLGVPWGHKRIWSNTNTVASTTNNGNGWFVTQSPFVREVTSDEVAVVIKPDEV